MYLSNRSNELPPLRSFFPSPNKHTSQKYSYAQTELGHGSNLSRLETTATLDIERDQWVINSPTQSSAKFWIGTLGKIANHAIVQAKLIINGKDYGAHPFLVPLRSLRDHAPLPGVVIKDQGPKQGAISMDNGYARFNNVRIPRENVSVLPVDLLTYTIF